MPRKLTLMEEMDHALRTLLVAVDSKEPEQFVGHRQAYLDTVAIPRARAAVAAYAERQAKGRRHAG
jgi:hypothetical protein